MILETWLAIVAILIVTSMVFVTLFFYRWRQSKDKRVDDAKQLLHHRIDALQAFMNDLLSPASQGQNPSDYLARKSPVGLSDAGVKLAEDSGITALVNQHFEQYAKKLHRHKNGMDRLSCCRRLALDELGGQAGNDAIKDYFYNDGLSPLLMQEIFALTLEQAYLNNQKQLSN